MISFEVISATRYDATMRNPLPMSLVALLFLVGCDKSTDPATVVENGRAATREAREAVDIVNGRTPNLDVLSRKISNAEDLIAAGQIDTARSLLDQVEPQKDLLSSAEQSRYEEARKKVAR